ncbi:MAG: ABC transporter substrate-binding protein, partial [Bacteroidetes bacterium]|nr:ABC transporter substrate-binding protein [Bacteroidota bacterium]
HISVASSRDYFEQDPLARAEWIKFFAAFINKEKMADSIFNKVKADYGFIRNSTAKMGERPTVFCNVPYNGIWYMPCGKNYVARLFTDAGSTFLWQKDEPINGLNLTLNFEQVYERAANADFWMNPGVVSSLAQLSDQDTKFKLYKAFKTGQVYNCTNRLSTGGGMDMWETGTFRPDLVLRDLSLIFHGGSSQDLYYYKKLK